MARPIVLFRSRNQLWRKPEHHAENNDAKQDNQPAVSRHFLLFHYRLM
jgi:hypothetical protein